MDNMSIIVAMCIGNMVAWLMAIYTERGAWNLMWNVILGAAGAIVWGLAIARVMPDFRVAGLLAGGPLFAMLTILAGHAAWRQLRALAP